MGTIKEITHSGRTSPLSSIKLNNFKIISGHTSTRQDNISLLRLSMTTAFPGLSIPDAFLSSSNEIRSSTGPFSVHLGGTLIVSLVFSRF